MAFAFRIYGFFQRFIAVRSAEFTSLWLSGDYKAVCMTDIIRYGSIYHENFYIKHIKSSCFCFNFFLYILANGAEWECEFVSAFVRRIWGFVWSQTGDDIMSG